MCLLQTTSCVDEEADELVDLYFCKGWHRTGWRYAVSSSERRRVLRLLFLNAPESAPRSERSSTEKPAFTYQEDVTSPETISADISTETTRMRLRPVEATGTRRRSPCIQSQDLRMTSPASSPPLIFRERNSLRLSGPGEVLSSKHKICYLDVLLQQHQATNGLSSGFLGERN